MVPVRSLMVLVQTWPKFTRIRSRWLRRRQVLQKTPLQQAPPPQGHRRPQIPRLPVRHLFLKVLLQQIGPSVHLDLLLGRPMAQRHQHKVTALLQDLAKAPIHLRERSVLHKVQKETLGQSHLHQAIQDLLHQLVIEMIHMLEVRDLRKREIWIPLIKGLSLVMCGVVLASI